MHPIPYTPEIEIAGADEAQLISEIVGTMAASQRCAFERHRHALRDAHAKSNGLLTGALTVHADLPAALRQGVFAAPRTYQVVARLSSAPSDIHTDEIPAARGFALKLIGVEGEREWQARQREAMGDKAKKDLAMQPAFKAELRSGANVNGSASGNSADKDSADPFGRLRQSSDPFERLRACHSRSRASISAWS